MLNLTNNIWREEDGVLSFEWTLLVTLLVIGIVSGVAAARDAIIDELGDVAQTMLVIDQTYTVAFPLLLTVHEDTVSSSSDTVFVDALIYSDCDRANLTFAQSVTQQLEVFDEDS